MSLADTPNDKIVLVLGGPRSGTTWLAKIFDSHPDVLYRHEPDTVLRDRAVQGIFSLDDIPRYRQAAHDYLRQLLTVSTLKSSGSLPIFRKNYHSPLAHIARKATVFGLRALDGLSLTSRFARAVPVPDMLQGGAYPDLRVVIKSVSSRGRVGLFARALPGARVVFIVRDPCGQIASMTRGAALGKFDGPAAGELLGTEQARLYGLTPERLRALPPIEQYAWHWAILNEKAISDLDGLPTGRVVRYQDLCGDPLGVSRDLFSFAGLGWAPRTEAFIGKSTRANGPDRYYQVFKDPATSLNKWRNQLAVDDQRRIMAVVRKTSMWRLCPEYYS